MDPATIPHRTRECPKSCRGRWPHCFRRATRPLGPGPLRRRPGERKAPVASHPSARGGSTIREQRAHETRRRSRPGVARTRASPGPASRRSCCRRSARSRRGGTPSGREVARWRRSYTRRTASTLAGDRSFTAMPISVKISPGPVTIAPSPILIAWMLPRAERSGRPRGDLRLGPPRPVESVKPEDPQLGLRGPSRLRRADLRLGLFVHSP